VLIELVILRGAVARTAAHHEDTVLVGDLVILGVSPASTNPMSLPTCRSVSSRSSATSRPDTFDRAAPISRSRHDFDIFSATVLIVPLLFAAAEAAS
jgi:hypothetical protein